MGFSQAALHFALFAGSPPGRSGCPDDRLRGVGFATARGDDE